jgi:hypothetical protein
MPCISVDIQLIVAVIVKTMTITSDQLSDTFFAKYLIIIYISQQL